MTTRIYGTSDDLVEIEGDLDDEVHHVAWEGDRGVLLLCSDGTSLVVQYGKPLGAVWRVDLVRAGPLFLRIDVCESESAEIYSDVAHFRDGLTWILASAKWDRIAAPAEPGHEGSCGVYRGKPCSCGK